MTSSKFLALSTLFLAALGQSVAAGAVEYHCDYKLHGRGGFLSEKAIFVVDADKRTAKALDRVISSFYKKPIEVKYSRPSQKRMQLDWTVSDFPVTSSSNQRLEIAVKYKVTINVTDNSSKVRARFDRDARNNLSASGRCTIK
ncbi:hypothetical protein [Shimia haliotis]|uniref:Uncharacterized protein n=1 Tax=Shimia haliotis TaxID=1280847 RepID=A0A1I4BHE0_9RHOB|nr:hypothetical protein [Shimia haliotis]SFK68245.1 hypothetical protein SAMN04488036_1011043 [Shimia haliotis]